MMVYEIKQFLAVISLSVLLYLIAYIPSTSTRLYHRYFLLQRNPRRRGPVRLGKAWIDKSRKSCAKNCMKTYEDCTSFLFNSETGLCTPGSWINEKQPLPSIDEGDFYQSFYCDTSKGFSVRTYGATKACVGYFGPSNYTNADADCQRMGAYLMPVKTVEKYFLLYYNVSKNTNTWVGCDDIVDEGKFIWKDDGQLLTAAEKSSVFAQGEPNNYLNAEDCITVVANSRGLMDYNCSYLHHYACEMPYR